MLLIETQYLPPIYVFYMILMDNHRGICIENHEIFQKPLYRNRCLIPTADGTQTLSIPLQGGRDHRKTAHATTIDNTQTWQRKHWHAMQSAYNNAPYFEYYAHIFEKIYQKKYVNLLDFNNDLLQACLHILKINADIIHTKDYQKKYDNDDNIHDLRNFLKPNMTPSNFDTKYQNLKYLQVFADRQPFAHNVSIVDLIFNEGKYATDFLLTHIQKP